MVELPCPGKMFYKKDIDRLLCNVTYSKFILIGSPILAKDKFFKVMEMELQRPLLVAYWLKETAHHRVTKPLQTVSFKLAGEMHLITI